MCWNDRPAAARTAPRFCSTWVVCAAVSWPTMAPVAGSTGIWPETNRKSPCRMAWLYGPMAAGASGVETASRPSRGGSVGGMGDCREPGLGGLDHLVGSDAPGAHAKPADPAVHDGANPLQVGLEAPGADVVGVADDPSEDGCLPADFTLLGHVQMRPYVMAGRARGTKNAQV